MSREAGKDHFRRPSKVSQEELDNRWEQTFGKKEKDLTDDKNDVINIQNVSNLTIKM